MAWISRMAANGKTASADRQGGWPRQEYGWVGVLVGQPRAMFGDVGGEKG